MTKYSGKIEAKEIKIAKNKQEYVCFTIAEKKWNCFDAITNKEFNVGEYVGFESELKYCCKNPQPTDDDSKCFTCGNEYKKFENLIPETMKKIDAPEPAKGNPQAVPQKPFSSGETIQRIIQEDRDSFEIGTPGKLGCLKIYLDFGKPDEAIKKIENAKKVRDEANRLLSLE